jgi:hypothetical protein
MEANRSRAPDVRAALSLLIASGEMENARLIASREMENARRRERRRAP